MEPRDESEEEITLSQGYKRGYNFPRYTGAELVVGVYAQRSNTSYLVQLRPIGSRPRALPEALPCLIAMGSRIRDGEATMSQ